MVQIIIILRDLVVPTSSINSGPIPATRLWPILRPDGCVQVGWDEERAGPRVHLELHR